MARVIIAVAFLFFVLPLRAQHRPNLPDAPKQKIDRRVFIAGVSLLAASQVTDALSTRSLLDRGGWENNPVYGRHPSNARLTGINAAFFIAQTTAFYFTERSPHRWLRWTGRTLMAFSIGEHTRLAACNSAVDTHSSTVQNCHSIGF